MVGWGFADFFAKKTIDIVGDLVSLAWAHIFGVAVILGFVLTRVLSKGELTGIPDNYSEMLMLLFFGALQAMVYFFVYRGFGKGKLSLLNPVFSSYSAFVVILSVFIFGEAVGLSVLFVLALVFLGIMLINIDEESIELRRVKFLQIQGIKDILVAVVLATIWTISWGRFVANKDWLIYAAFMYVFMSITILVICLMTNAKLKITKSGIWKYFFLIGFSEVIAYVGISIGYSLTSHLSIVAVLSAAFSVPTIILAHYFLKEKITKLQLFGVMTVIVGVVLISLI